MKLGIGTAQFGLNYGIGNHQGQISHSEAKAILEHASANGIDTLDTAIAYGESEVRLGEIGVEDWHVVSKLPAIPEGWRDMQAWVWESVERSLGRLRIGKLYGLLLHRPDQLLTGLGQALFQALEKLKDKNFVQKIGISIYAPEELDALCWQYHFDIVQAPFNVLDRRMIHSGWLSRLTKNGTEVHVRSVFLQGLLLMPPEDRPRKFNRWQGIWHDWDAWLEETELTPLMACIRYALSFPEISKVIVGVDSQAQLEEILIAADGPMPQVPAELHCSDVNLINPTHWQTL
jgi:aryl-alcohol dehydrogenase-like predicted oxidoreductase